MRALTTGARGPSRPWTDADARPLESGTVHAPASGLRRDGRRRPAGCARTGRRSSTASTTLGLAESSAAAGRMRRHLIRENGVTYNVYGDPRGMDRPWQLDPIPLLIPPADAGGARGRAGPAGPAARPDPRRPVRPAAPARERAPARRSWSSPTRASCAPATALQVPGGRYLHLYAADLGRAADGSFVVLADRTQAPPAPATRWRTASSCRACCRRSSATARCSGWPRSSGRSATRSRSIAPHNRDNPRVVLLTPGPVQRDLLRARLPRPLPRATRSSRAAT